MARSSHISMDGKSSVDQGDYFPQQSVGSKSALCDLDTQVSWWLIIQRASESRVKPIPRDENGQPHRLCSNGHYSPIAAYSVNKGREDGYDNYCKQCRAEIQRKVRLQEAEAEGRLLRDKAGRPKKLVNQTA